MASNPKILIVDDFEMMRFQLRGALSTLGYLDVTEASDGAIASELIVNTVASSATYDIIFCDWNMPNVTGFDVLKMCRSLPGYEKTPFVMVTAEAEQEAVVKAVKAGASDYIVKPVGNEALQVRLKAIFGRFLSLRSAA